MEITTILLCLSIGFLITTIFLVIAIFLIVYTPNHWNDTNDYLSLMHDNLDEQNDTLNEIKEVAQEENEREKKRRDGLKPKFV